MPFFPNDFDCMHMKKTKSQAMLLVGQNKFELVLNRDSYEYKSPFTFHAILRLHKPEPSSCLCVLRIISVKVDNLLSYCLFPLF